MAARCAVMSEPGAVLCAYSGSAVIADPVAIDIDKIAVTVMMSNPVLCASSVRAVVADTIAVVVNKIAASVIIAAAQAI